MEDESQENCKSKQIEVEMHLKEKEEEENELVEVSLLKEDEENKDILFSDNDIPLEHELITHIKQEEEDVKHIEATPRIVISTKTTGTELDNAIQEFQQQAKPNSTTKKQNRRFFTNIHLLNPLWEVLTFVLLNPSGKNVFEFVKKAFKDIQETSDLHVYTKDEKKKEKSLSLLNYIRSSCYRQLPLHLLPGLGMQFLLSNISRYIQNDLNYKKSGTFQHKIFMKRDQNLLKEFAEGQIHRKDKINAKKSVRMPSNVPGSDQEKRKRLFMSQILFAKVGSPDLFVTFTINHRHPEIIKACKELGKTTKEDLKKLAKDNDLELFDMLSKMEKDDEFKLNSNPHDHPWITVPWFLYKFKKVQELFANGVVCKGNKSVYQIWVYEFQKRGGIHAHMLIKLEHSLETPKKS